MAPAANTLAESGGGAGGCGKRRGGQSVERPSAKSCPLKTAVDVAEKTNTILEGFRACGCKLNNPNMQLSLLALVVIPELRITDKGLVDGTTFTSCRSLKGRQEKIKEDYGTISIPAFAGRPGEADQFAAG